MWRDAHKQAVRGRVGHKKKGGGEKKIILQIVDMGKRTRFVLSAAHCFSNPSLEPVNVLLGELDLSKKLDCVPNSHPRLCLPEPQEVT